jgi:hypothetical protein
MICECGTHRDVGHHRGLLYGCDTTSQRPRSRTSFAPDPAAKLDGCGYGLWVPSMRPTREQLAHHFLPQYREADLAGRVLTITDAELERIGDLAGYYAWSEEALELLGGSMGGTRAACLATIDVLERTMRDLRQNRSLQELDWGTPERSPAELAQERSFRLRANAGEQPRSDA